MTDTNELGMLLRRRRKLLGKTLADVSKASGVDISSISDYERGAKQPTSGRLIAVCDALGIDILKELRGE
jgi:transcriptional regulator with XRE-family HTH domain